MAERPTSASVTDVSCSCGYLARAADDPDVPIVFDERTGEFHFTYYEPGECVAEEWSPAMLVIFHCPFCGGAAPPSKRALLFHAIPRAEEQRLFTILTPLKNIDAAITALGPPDWDNEIGGVSRTSPDDGKPSVVTCSRRLCYQRLSEIADVWLDNFQDGVAYWSLQGKPLKRVEGESTG
jgi:hypothetical protein